MADIMEKSSVPLEAAVVSNGPTTMTTTGVAEVATAPKTPDTFAAAGIPAQATTGVGATTTVNDSHSLLLKEQQHQQEQIIYQQQKEQQQLQQQQPVAAAAAAAAVAASALDVKQAQPEQKGKQISESIPIRTTKKAEETV
ncbi:ataxin-2-like [Rhagoletis pomonella]|uniref:ataxin-2-like n=1 Tax=Rhagoletis pomonella TaxID=28610 RepID=UPI00177CA8B3|nr:ataxin-2-like [Rhagoletis pomonella]XP_036325190.1 ataxin-2-like [Rhagoletis pomonella]XP_036325191.1 ataxin-2-like [Rhagoletis pomonella]